MAAKIHYEKDAPIAPLQGKKVAVIGFGSQGHAHSLNLRDSGIEVGVAELPGTPNFKLATEHGFKPGDIKTAMNGAALIIVTLPDEMQGKIYQTQIAPNLKAGQTLGFCHGFNIHFGYIVPPKDINVVMIAPKGPGHLVRSRVPKRRRPFLPDRHPPGRHRPSPAGSRPRLFQGSGRHTRQHPRQDFKEETETDLFGEQVSPLRRHDGIGEGGLRDAGRGRLSAGTGLLRVPPRAEADRRSDAERRASRAPCATPSRIPPSSAT